LPEAVLSVRAPPLALRLGYLGSLPKNEITIALRGRRIDMATLASLKSEWRVSMQYSVPWAVDWTNREAKATWLWRKFAMERMKLREPPSLDFAPEMPGVVSRMVRLHLDNFGYSPSELAKIVHANDNLLAEYYDLSAKPVVQGMRLRVVR
jgi:hypothetical protein